MGFENVGKVWTLASLEQYLGTIKKPGWCTAITMHHTGDPSLADYPKGLTIKYIENTRDYYKKKKPPWSAGPHLFIDEDQIFGMCDLRKNGIHAVKFNSYAIGIEVLGNYDVEDPKSGRGMACWQNATAAVVVLLNWLGFKADKETILFHREDPHAIADKKYCPGTKVKKDWVLDLIAAVSVPR